MVEVGVTRVVVPLEDEVQGQLHKPGAAYRMLNYTQAASRRERRRTSIVGKEINVVIGRVEVGMIKHIESVGLKAQLETILDGKLLSQARVEAHLEWTPEEVPAGIPVK
jgi:hypothetical protein